MDSWKNKSLTHPASRGKFFRDLFAYLTLFAALGAMVFFGVCTPDSPESLGPMGPAGKVEGDEISRIEFRRAYENTQEQYRRIYGEAFDPRTFMLAKTVLDNMIDERVGYKVALELGFYIADEEIEKQILDIFKDENGKFSQERFKNALQNFGYTEATLSEEIRRGLIVNQMRSAIAGSYFLPNSALEWDYRIKESKLNLEFLKLEPKQVQVTLNQTEIQKFLVDKNLEEAKKYFADNTSEFNSPKKVRARHILISYEGAKRAAKEASGRTKEVALKMANEVLNTVLAPGSDFIKIAEAKTDEASGKAKGGDLGFFAKEDMAPEFSEAAFSMSAGEITKKVVETAFGFHIIKVEEIKEELKIEFESAKFAIAKKLMEKQQVPEELKKRAEEITSALKGDTSGLNTVVKKYNLAWADTGEFNLSATSIPKLGSDKQLKDAVFSLSSAAPILDKPVQVGDNYFVVRLKNFTPAKTENFNAKSQKDAQQSMAGNFAFTWFNKLKENKKKSLEKAGNIEISKQYLSLDQAGEDGSNKGG